MGKFANEQGVMAIKKMKRRRKEQAIHELDAHYFHKKGVFTEREKLLFYETKYYDYQLKKFKVKYVFSEPWRFMLRVRAHFITKVAVKNLELE